MAVKAVKQEELVDGKLSELVIAQLCKTRMCGMFLKGRCTAKKCRFAHSPEELRPSLDLTKTAMCRMFARGKCDDPACKYAHGEQELRVTSTVYKTQLCNFHQRGFCKKGVKCRHAHGEHELRSFQTTARTSGTTEDAWSPASESSQDADAIAQNGATMSEDTVDLSPKALFTSNERDSLEVVRGVEVLEGTPPHSFAAPDSDRRTPEKVMPVFPGLQAQAPKLPEPMKVALLSDQDELSPASTKQMRQSSVPQENPLAIESLDVTQFGLAGEPVDQMAYAAHIAKIAQREFQAAQFKAQQQMRIAMEMAAAAHRGVPQVPATTAQLPGNCSNSVKDLANNKTWLI
jgi:hypothetical protein